MNWLLIGALLLCFPQMRVFEYVLTPVSLFGIALLHATLITLMGYNEGLYSGHGDVREQARMLAKSVLWATALLGFALGLQASWATRGVICGSGLLNFGALLTWRWRNGKHDRSTDFRGPVRNVLIVGAGAVGERVAAYLEGHAEAGRFLYGFLDNEKPLGGKVIGRVSDLARLSRTGFVDEVILAAPRDRDMALSVLHEAQRLRLDVEMVPELFGCEPVGMEV
jgi:FlaA1/EpsC-like NDP-sugar epimerase